MARATVFAANVGKKAASHLIIRKVLAKKLPRRGKRFPFGGNGRSRLQAADGHDVGPVFGTAVGIFAGSGQDKVYVFFCKFGNLARICSAIWHKIVRQFGADLSGNLAATGAGTPALGRRYAQARAGIPPDTSGGTPAHERQSCRVRNGTSPRPRSLSPAWDSTSHSGSPCPAGCPGGRRHQRRGRGRRWHRRRGCRRGRHARPGFPPG